MEYYFFGTAHLKMDFPEALLLLKKLNQVFILNKPRGPNVGKCSWNIL